MHNISGNEPLRAEYQARINRAMDFMEQQLDRRQLALDDIASAACFSTFHFHRIFSALVGETPGAFLTRIRLERAASLLLTLPQQSVGTIMERCGFTDSAVFSRAFKRQFAASPQAWRRSESKQSQADGKHGQASENTSGYPVEHIVSRRNTMQTLQTQNRPAAMPYLEPERVELRELPAMTLAYVRHTGPYAANAKLFERLFTTLSRWAGPRDLFAFGEGQSLCMYHDDPNITDESKLRLSVAMPVPAGTQGSGEVSIMEMAGGRCALLRYRLGVTDFSAAWNYTYGCWLPESGYQGDDRPCFELYNDPSWPDPAPGQFGPDGKMQLSIVIPVKPL